MGTATQQEIVAMKLNESAASCLLFGTADNWDEYEWPLGHVPQMLNNLLIKYVPRELRAKQCSRTT